MTVARWYLRTGAGLVVAASVTGVADDVYKTIDAQGHITYSDRALSPDSKKVTVEVIEGDPQEAARLAKERALVNADAAEKSKQAQQQAAEQQKQQAQDAAQKRQCDSARSRYAMFAAGGRIFKVDDQGNRSYYSDQEIDDQRIATKAAMDSACSQ